MCSLVYECQGGKSCSSYAPYHSCDHKQRPHSPPASPSGPSADPSPGGAVPPQSRNAELAGHGWYQAPAISYCYSVWPPSHQELDESSLNIQHPMKEQWEANTPATAPVSGSCLKAVLLPQACCECCWPITLLAWQLSQQTGWPSRPSPGLLEASQGAGDRLKANPGVGRVCLWCRGQPSGWPVNDWELFRRVFPTLPCHWCPLNPGKWHWDRLSRIIHVNDNSKTWTEQVNQDNSAFLQSLGELGIVAVDPGEL